MILAFDTYYFNNKAKTVCISFEEVSQEQPTKIYAEITNDIAPYISGEFYKRELPCILSLIKQINLNHIKYIIVDGFVHLDDNNKKGLGAYLYEALQQKIPVIGVAKKDFETINKNRIEVYRGKSQNPLYISSIGIDLTLASKYIEKMHGDYRIPTLLKTLDIQTKSNI